MKFRPVHISVLLATLFSGTPVRAQMAVIDGPALAQLKQQVTYWQQQLSAISAEVTATQQQLAAATGTRGMGSLLPLTSAQRNYLPMTAAGIIAATSAPQPADPSLHVAYVGAVGAQTGLSPQSFARLSRAEQTVLASRRAAVATRSSVMQSALDTASQRFAALQGLIDEIDLTVDQKGSLDLQGRIAAEQAMTQNESAKLAAVAGWADAGVDSAQTLAHETALAAHGDFAGRFHPAAP